MVAIHKWSFVVDSPEINVKLEQLIQQYDNIKVKQEKGICEIRVWGKRKNVG